MDNFLSLGQAYRCTRSLEAIENYAQADISTNDVRGFSSEEPYWISGMRDFWSKVLSNPDQWWGRTVVLEGVLSEWTGRIPGLYWSKNAESIRRLHPSAMGTYLPDQKSMQVVLGGIGTLRLPPDEHHRRLCTLTKSNSAASSGVPVLIYPEIWEHYRLGEGDQLRVVGSWQKMELGWAERFPSVRGIPRGYLLIKEMTQIKANIYASKAPTWIEPCTVMEYQYGNILLWDFVFATARTSDTGYRKALEIFFDNYKMADSRYGRYLLASDINNPLWEAEYTNPEQLRRAEIGAVAQMDLIHSRIHGVAFKGKTIEIITDALAANFSIEGMKTLSNFIRVPLPLWLTGGTSSLAAIQLMDICIKQNKVEELLDAMTRQYPELLMPEIPLAHCDDYSLNYEGMDFESESELVRRNWSASSLSESMGFESESEQVRRDWPTSSVSESMDFGKVNAIRSFINALDEMKKPPISNFLDNTTPKLLTDRNATRKLLTDRSLIDKPNKSGTEDEQV